MKKNLFILFLLIFFAGRLFAQKQITGQVLDKAGEPMPGVNVVLKGTTQGTITDLNGNYTIKDVPDDGILVFSFVGMVTQETAVGNRVLIDITLEAETTELDEVVVVGYGDVKRANILGSVADISSEDIKEIPAANLSTLLEGKLSGVRIGQSSGNPAASTSMQIRTVTSWNNEEPIFVIDGVIYEDQSRFDILDPSEVESISVLKDASGSVYGARAAGGVVIVKTKRGREGRPKINYSGSYGFSDATKFPEMLSSAELAQMKVDELTGRHWNIDSGGPTSALYDEEYYITPEQMQELPNYNWLEEAWGSSYITRHTVNVSGGSERVSYFGGGSYYYETGNFDNLFIEKYTLRLGIDAEVTKDLTASMSLSTGNKKTERPFNSTDSESDPLRGTFGSLLQTPPWIPSYIDGLPVYDEAVISHPLEIERIGSYARGHDVNYNLNTSLEYKIPFVQGLKLKLGYGHNTDNGYGKSYRVPYILYGFEKSPDNPYILTNDISGDPRTVNNDNRLEYSSSNGKNYQLNAGISYARSYGKHDVSAMLVYEQSESESYSFSTYNSDLLVETYERLGGFTEALDENNDGASAGGRLSYIGRLNYSFAEKYLLETAFRYEGSVKFPPESRMGFFPSVSIGWRISEEAFFKDNITFIDYLKFRASAGLVGNDRIGSRQWEQSFAIADGAYLGGSSITNGLEPRRGGIALRSFTWEKSESYNGGFDMRFLKNFSLSVDGFYRYTYDILNQRRSLMPASTGIEDVPEENYGRMEAWGWEFEGGYDAKVSQELSVHLSANLSFARARVLAKFQNPAVLGTHFDEIGRMPNGEVGWIATGIVRTQAEADSLNAMGWTIYGDPVEPGMMNYLDVGSADYSDSLDGKIDSWDKRILEPYSSPPFTYGFSVGVSWKNLRLDANFKGSFGHNVYMEKEAFILPDNLENENVLAFWKDHWTYDNPDAKYPRVYENAADQRSTFWARKGSILRLTSITLSYDLPRALSDRFKIPAMTFNVTARNIWTPINPFDYKDPSISQYNGYPLLKSYNFGVNITL